MPDSPAYAVLDERTKRLEASHERILEAIGEVNVGIGRIGEQLREGNGKFDRFERQIEGHATRLALIETAQAVAASRAPEPAPGAAPKAAPEPASGPASPLRVTIGVTGSAGLGAAAWEFLRSWFSSGAHPPAH